MSVVRLINLCEVDSIAENSTFAAYFNRPIKDVFVLLSKMKAFIRMK